MAEGTDQPARIQELINAKPVEVAGKVIQPIVRMDGWWQAVNGSTGNGGGALVRLSPASIEVRDGDQTYSVPVTDPTQPALRTFLYLGGAVSAVCLLIMLIAALATRRG